MRRRTPYSSDEKWLCFILNQLISNAVKYRRDPPVLTFRAVRDQDTLTLLPADNGIGIDARDLPRIFDKGFTGQKAAGPPQTPAGWGSTSANACATSWTSASRPNPPQGEPPFP